MPHDRRRLVPVGPAEDPAPPRQVGVLVVEEVGRIEPADVVQERSSDEHRRTRPREHLFGLVEASVVGFEVAAVGGGSVGVQHDADVVDQGDRIGDVVGRPQRAPLGPMVDCHLGGAVPSGHGDCRRAAAAGQAELEGRVTIEPVHVHLRDRPPVRPGERAADGDGVVLPAPEAGDELDPVRDVYAVDARAAELNAEVAVVATPGPDRRRADLDPNELPGQQHLRCRGSQFRIRLERRDQRLQPPRLRDGVVVQKGDVLAIRQRVEAEVAGATEAQIRSRLDEPHRGEVPLHLAHPARLRAVVDEADRQPVPRPREDLERVQAPDRHVAAEVVDDDDPDHRHDVGGHMVMLAERR